MAKRRKKNSISVDSVKHKDKRANIPTEELRDFVADEEKSPGTMLYPRDPSLDPQMVWTGKDEQDQEGLEVPVVPIYIQEKIHPQAIVEDIRSLTKRPGGDPQADLFSDFNNIEFENLIEFYQHEQNWSNRMVLGDSLLVMTSLAEKEGLKGKVQMVYFDPPYGINFSKNWQISTRTRNVSDTGDKGVTRQPEQIRAFRDTWELGINSYLSYLRDRLVVSRELLTETGSIFVQIGDENVHLVRCLLDEVFGTENFCQLIPFRKKLMPLGAKLLEGMCDFLLWYAKDAGSVKFRHLYKTSEPKYESRWTGVELSNGERKRLSRAESRDLPAGGRVYRLVSQRAPSFSEANVYEIHYCGREFESPKGGCWVTSKEKMHRLAASGRLEEEGDSLSYVYYHDDFPYSKLTNLWEDTSPAQDKQYIVQTSNYLLERCLLMTTDPGDLVLDPTSGSGTTAYVAEQWGRRWIAIDTSRVASALARTRIMTARYPYYLLVDSRDGIEKEAELTGRRPPEHRTDQDVRRGFVCRRAPHITLRSIANNEEIDQIGTKWQDKMDEVREGLERELRQSWEEWEIPLEPREDWSRKAKTTLKKWWKLHADRQAEYNASIARNSDQETLCDQPFEHSRKMRVTGPFTVESLSPHRVLSTEDASGDGTAVKEGAGEQFETMIIDNLKKAGVQNTVRNERLKFDHLQSFAGIWIHAEGEYTEKEGKTKRVAVCIGPEHGTVGPDLIKDAAKEAVQGMGFDLLVVCGFSFDPHVSEEAKRYGNLAVLIARMNPDLAMGDELLKKTGAGNLFMVFGEPDIAPLDKKTGKIRAQKNGKIKIEIKGVDVYDPTTGEIRNSSTDDIMCWFIDTNYNGESFFVRHAYFTGEDRPYDKLKRALRAEVDEEAWSALYSTVSKPFEAPESGKIAVKVINHYGDEVLKVFEVM